MFNYMDLSDVEFEMLAHDVMEKTLGISLHLFGKGTDGGIDLVDDLGGKNIIVQVKHYIRTPFSGLLNALKKELPKVREHKPKQYYVVCSHYLTPGNTKDIYNLFEDFMESSHNVISLTDIDMFLSREENIDIVKRHYKLWLHATNLLSDIESKNVFFDSQMLLANIKQRTNLYVETDAYRQAREILNKKRILMLIGPPGVGKTITSEMLVLFFAAQNYRIRYTTDGEDLGALKKAISENPAQKEIILLDDCLGQCYFKMKETQENELVSLVRYVSMSPNKLLLLNSRVTIYQEAKEKSPTFYKEIANGDLKIHILDMSAISDIERAKIFYNHLYFSGLPLEYFENIKKDQNYRKIVFHPNYSPRIMEYVTLPNIQEEVPASKYYEYIKHSLDCPENIWKDEFSRRLQPVDRMLLTTLYSLTETVVDIDLLKRCFNYRVINSSGIDKTIDNFSASIKRLNESFIRVVSDKDIQKVRVLNPSVNDFLKIYVTSANSPEKADLCRTIINVNQAQRLLEDPDSFLREKTADGSILDFEFESERAKKEIVIYFVVKYHIFCTRYQQVVSDYLLAPCYVHGPNTSVMSKAHVLSTLLTTDFADFYATANHLSIPGCLHEILSDNDIDDMVLILNALDRFFQKGVSKRSDYLKQITPYLRESIEWYTTDIDAADASDGIDLYEIIRQNAIPEYGGIDELNAEQDLEDIIKTFAEDDLADKMSQLPEDIRCLINISKDVMFSVSGASSVIDAYIAPDPDMDDYYDRHGSQWRGNAEDEIDYLFNR